MMMTSNPSEHVKMEPPFYHKEPLNLQEFSLISGYEASGSPEGTQETHRTVAGVVVEPVTRFESDSKLLGTGIMLQGDLKKQNMATSVSAPVPVLAVFSEVIQRAGPVPPEPTGGPHETAIGSNPNVADGGEIVPESSGKTRGPDGSSIIANTEDLSLLPPASAAALSLLKLSPSELEHLLIQASSSISSPNPAPPQLPPVPTQAGTHAFLYRNQQLITQEQEGFVNGFVKALADLHKQNQLLGVPLSPNALASGSPTSYPTHSLLPAGELPVYTNLSSFNPTSPQLSPLLQAPTTSQGPYTPASPSGVVQLQFPGPPPLPRGPLDEPQTVPDVSQAVGVPAATVGSGGDSGSPLSLSPIDLETQERIKAERKRLRNRIAASKCRKRKLERISRLEEKVKVLKSQNSDLASTASLLREQVSQLKHKVMNHVSNGCHITVTKGSGPAGGKSEDTLSC